MTSPRVLVSAYQCGPGMGSVSQIGWEWYQRLAKQVPVTLVTHCRNRAALEQAGAPLPGSEVVYIDSEWFAGPLYRLASKLFPRSQQPVFLISSLDFYVYDWLALRQLQLMQRQGSQWDLVHAVTPVSPLAASRLYRLGIPLIVGPWNGGLKSPTTFPDIMRAESAWLYPIRRLGHVIDWLVGTSRHVSLILTATASTFNAIAPRYQPKCRPMLENGVDTTLFTPAEWPQQDVAQLLKIVFVGRLLPFKGVSMLLQAVAQLTLPFQLVIVGDGSERVALEQQCQQLGLVDKVVFAGDQPLAQVATYMQQAHVFCLPSVRESGGAVLLEAMAVGRPVIAVDFGGPAEIVDEEVGLKLPATGRDDVVAALRDALTDVVRNPQVWQQRGLAGQRRVLREFSWDAKITQALTIYRQLLQGGQ